MAKKKYRIKNWKEYNNALRCRSSLTLLIPENIVEIWYNKTEHSGRGRPQVYSDSAITIILQIRYLFNLPYRQAQGFLQSVFDKMHISITVPDYSQICRRAFTIDITVMSNTRIDRNSTLLFDGTGLKVYGDGEWKVRRHGAEKRRIWKQANFCIDADSKDIIGFETTYPGGSEAGFAQQFLRKLQSENKVPGKVIGDGAYDTHELNFFCDNNKIIPVIPPASTAKMTLEKYTNVFKPLGSRDKNIQAIRKHGLKKWKKASGYHVRSLVENSIGRYKTIFGGKCRSRKDVSITSELIICSNLMNSFNRLGLPESIPIT